jgi:hypothetical protein
MLVHVGIYPSITVWPEISKIEKHHPLPHIINTKLHVASIHCKADKCLDILGLIGHLLVPQLSSLAGGRYLTGSPCRHTRLGNYIAYQPSSTSAAEAHASQAAVPNQAGITAARWALEPRSARALPSPRSAGSESGSTVPSITWMMLCKRVYSRLLYRCSGAAKRGHVHCTAAS